MTREELLELIAEVQRHRSELADVEVKAARGGTPRRLYEGLSAFANETDGGVFLFGLDEEGDFDVVGVGDPQRLQEEVAAIASSQMDPPLRPTFCVEQVDGKTVVAIEIPEVRAIEKPCYYKTAGLQAGSYIRVGNTNRHMTDYEIFGYLSERQQPRLDEESVADATLADLDRTRLDAYLAALRQVRPGAAVVALPVERALEQLRVVRSVDGVLRPTLAGLLVFGLYPQTFEPQLVITFLQFYGTTEDEKTPFGERFLDNRKFEGPIPEMVEGAVNHILATIRKSSLIDGVYRRDIPEYPVEAFREAILNAVAHRDYSHYVRGSYIQVRLFADRLEIQSPGGLYGSVTEETLEHQQSTRNRLLMRFMEDLRLVENRGSGIRGIIGAMRQANLEPPRFQDRRLSFLVTLRSQPLITPDAIAWLNQLAQQPLNDAQRLALVHLRRHDQLTVSDFRWLNHVDAETATHDLRGLVRAGLVERHSQGRGAYYTLKVSTEVVAPRQLAAAEEQVLAFVREHGSVTNAQCRALLDLDFEQASHLLTTMYRQGRLRREGRGRWTTYHLP